MLRRDYRDMAAGGLLVAFGLFIAFYASANYDLGTFRRMGPGMFPAGLGYIMAGFGVVLFVQALRRPGVMPEIRYLTPLFILAGVAAFGLLIRPFGLMPAIVAATVISSMAELKVRPISLTLLCISLCVIAWLVFSVALGLPMLMFRWPF